MSAVGAARRLGPGAWEVASSRPGEPPYQVHRTGPAAQCTCPGFQRWQTCKHVDLVLRQPEPQEAPMQPQPPQRALTRVPVQPPAPLAVEEPSRALANLSVQDVAQLADRLASAQGFLPKGITEPAQVFAIVLTGQEIGIGPMAALRHIPMVEGKPDPSAELLLALIRHRYGPQTIRVAESTADHCTVEWRQPGWDGVQSFTWTVKDSERAGLHKKFNHQAYPAAMNRARAIKFVARSHFPEVALGLDLGGEEERGAVIPSLAVSDVTTGEARVRGETIVAAPRRGTVNEAQEMGMLTADELAPGGVHRGERGGILEDAEPAYGEVVGLAECASCGTVAECVFDGEAYICADNVPASRAAERSRGPMARRRRCR
jgi:hypothetical protein